MTTQENPFIVVCPQQNYYPEHLQFIFGRYCEFLHPITLDIIHSIYSHQ